MIARTNQFKDEIKKLGKQIDFKINVYTNDKIITENNKFLMTENNLHLVVEQFDMNDIDEVIQSEDIYNVSVVRKGNLLSTMMQEIDFEIKQDLRVGDIVGCSFGLKVGENYEYIDYGKFIVFSKEHNEDTDTYSYVTYDSMLLSMIEVDDVSIIEGVTVQQAIENICEKVGLSVTITEDDIETLPNLEKEINAEAFNNIEMTYRDVLDMICQCLGISMISNEKVLYLKTLNNTIVDSFDEEYLKDVNVKFGEKYGPVNSVVLSRSEDNDTIYRRDEDSIALNGIHEFKIKDNLIMLYDDREDYIDEIFEQLNGTEFYINDFTSTGITYLEPLDFYNIIVGDNNYKCLLLNNEIKIQQGLEETIYTEIPEETTTDYKISSKTDKEVSFIVDKQNGSIKAKVSKGDVINEINLDTSGASIKAEKINLTGYVTATDLAGSGTTTINGSNITTGTINANLITSGSLSADRISGGQLLITGNYTGQNSPFMQVTHPNSSGSAPVVTRIWGNGISVADYRTSGSNALIRTENSSGYAELKGSVVNAFGFNNVSLANKKKDFELLESGLDIINKIDIYKYNYKNENDCKKHIGVVIGDEYNYSKEITSNNNEEIDVYSFVSVCCKAIQEQQKQIEELKQEIKSLKGDDI